MPRTRRMNHEGSICKKSDGRYVWKQMIDGVSRSATARSMPELAEKIERYKGLPAATGKIRVADWNKKWLDIYVKNLCKPATYEQYKYMIKHIDAVLGKRYMKTITEMDIQQVISEANKRGASSATMKHIRKVARLSFKQALKEKVVRTNPADDVMIPTKTPKTKKVLTPGEFAALLKHLEGTRWYHAVWFVISTAVRRGELLAIRESDIDEQNKTITIRYALDREGNLSDTKDSDVHYVPLTDIALEALQNQRKMLRQEKNPVLLRSRSHPERWVFPNRYGDALIPGSLYKIVSDAGKEAGVKATPHMLRHTFVNINKRRLSLSELKEILGHEETTTTLDIYGKMINESLEHSIDPMNEAMAEFKESMKQAEDAEKARSEAEDNVLEGKVLSFARKAN